MRFKVKQTCYCEHYLYDITSHYRPNVFEMRLDKDDIVTFEKESITAFGHFYQVEKDGKSYFIPPAKLEPYAGQVEEESQDVFNDWDDFAQKLYEELGESPVEEGDENDPYNYWLEDVSVADIVDFCKKYFKTKKIGNERAFRAYNR